MDGLYFIISVLTSANSIRYLPRVCVLGPCEMFSAVAKSRQEECYYMVARG